MNKLSELIQFFLQYQEISTGFHKAKSKSTIENYYRYLKKFLYFTENSLNVLYIEQLNLIHIDAFRLFLSREISKKTKKTLSIKTQGYYLIAIRAFFKFLN